MKSDETKQTRELLTHDRIKKAVKFKLTSDMIDHTYMLTRLLTAFVTLALVLHWILHSAWAWLLLLIPILYYAFFVSRVLVKWYKIGAGEYSVVEDRLVGIKEYAYKPDILTFWKGKLRDVYDIVTFAEHEEYEVEDRDILKYSLADDPFYLIVCDSAPQKPIAVFNARVYEWKGK